MGRTLLLAAVMALALAGIADSWYLVQAAYAGEGLACDFAANPSSCDIVAQSPFSRPFGIPLGAYGVAFYALILVLSSAALALRARGAERLLLPLAAAGALASAGFVAVQAFLIEAFCAYCIASAAIAFAMLAAAALLRRARPDMP